MKKTKFAIFFVLLFMIIGVAAVTTNLVINGTVNVAKNPDDFLVYFSDVKVNGTQDLSLVESEQKLVFNGEFSALGDKKVISYDVTNASKNYDAAITISCTESTAYLTISNSFDNSTNLSARSSRTGTLTLELSTAVSEETSQDVTCTISASAVERTSQGSGDVSTPVEKQIAIGDEISIGEEKFNVISTTDTTVTMLAQYNLGTDYRQSTTENDVTFSDSNGWEYTPGPKEIDIQTWSTNPKTYVNEYVSYLQGETGDTTLSGDLITLAELGNLGCTVPIDYAWGSGGWTCTGSEHSNWLINGQYWWTRTAFSDFSGSIWILFDDGDLYSNYYYINSGVRPVITISKSLI